jgi:hypothetical protein
MISKADYSLIPERVMNNLLAYVKGEEALGGFLYAVMTNDLFQAVGRADTEMKPLIPLLIHYIHWEIPGGCHGSPEHVKEWMDKKRNEKK